MKKIIFLVVLVVIIIVGVYAKDDLVLTLKQYYPEAFAEKPIVLEEVKLKDILVPVNHHGIQSLFVLDLILLVDKEQVKDLALYRLRSRIIEALSVKGDDYFFDKYLIKNVKKEVLLILNDASVVPIKDAMIIKAIYQ